MHLRFIVAWLCLGLPLPALTEERHLYLEAHGKQSHVYRWTRTVDENVVRIAIDEPGKAFLNQCDPDGATLAWSMKARDIEVEAWRRGNEIELRGRRAGKPFGKRVRIGNEPWYQPLSYSLRRRFAAHVTPPTRFWVLRPDTLEPVKLKAEREGQEAIDTTAGPRMAVKVRVSTTGMLTGLWEAHYWFDAATAVFLRFEGVTGLPGSPKTVVERIE